MRRRVGRFLPRDPRVSKPYRLTPRLAFRIALFGGIAIALFGILTFRLWALQVISGDTYLDQARNNQVRTARVDGTRGPIVDVRGRLLVGNEAATVVRLWPGDVPEERRETLIRDLAELLNVPEKDIRQDIERVKEDPLTPVIVRSFVRDGKAPFIL